MANIAYVNGEFIPTDYANISINDRGLQFGDAVYEVWAVINGKLIDEEGHFTRLGRSLNELDINNIFNKNSLKIIFRELLARNRVKNGIIYLQISRGTAPRDHAYAKNLVPNIIITARPKNFAQLEAKAQKGFHIKIAKDNRWGRVDIKTTNLLPNVLAKQNALDNNFDDVWFVDENNFITEGSAQNAWIIKDNTIITRALSHEILAGITRQSVLNLIKKLNLKFEERAFKVDELYNSDEAFVTSATSFVTPIIKVDSKNIGDGKIGEVVKLLRKEYLKL